MDFDVAQIDPQIAYKLMTSTITPRPIAWVTSLSEQGVVNAAPYSFFNAMGSNPATVVVGLLRDPKKGFKDTAANIMNRGGICGQSGAGIPGTADEHYLNGCAK